MNLLHIFKANKRAEASGVTLADVQSAVKNYDPALHEAPIVIGHPKTDDPAYGWVGKLSLGVDNTVLAQPKQIVTEFAEWVNQGLYKKISASWYGKSNPDNPTPGQLYLKHVGYLGAVPPVIKGMPDSSFSESDGEVITIEFSEAEFADYDDLTQVRLWQNLRDWLIESQDLATADRVVPSYMLETLQMSAMSEPDEPLSNYSEKPMPLTEEELKQREDALALRERNTVLKEQELLFSEALDGVIKEGRILGVEKPAHLKRLKMLSAIPADSVVDFAEGKENYSPTQEYLDELKKRPVVVNFGEISGGEAPENISADPVKRAQAIDKKRSAAAKEGRLLSFAEADAELNAQGEQN